MVGYSNKKYIWIFLDFFYPPVGPYKFLPKNANFLKIFLKSFICDFFVLNERIYERKCIKKNSKIYLHSNRAIFTQVYKNSIKRFFSNLLFVTFLY